MRVIFWELRCRSMFQFGKIGWQIIEVFSITGWFFTAFEELTEFQTWSEINRLAHSQFMRGSIVAQWTGQPIGTMTKVITDAIAYVLPACVCSVRLFRCKLYTRRCYTTSSASASAAGQLQQPGVLQASRPPAVVPVHSRDILPTNLQDRLRSAPHVARSDAQHQQLSA